MQLSSVSVLTKDAIFVLQDPKAQIPPSYLISHQDHTALVEFTTRRLNITLVREDPDLLCDKRARPPFDGALPESYRAF